LRTIVRLAGKLISGVLVAAVVYMAVQVVRQALRADDGGPPMGALGMACPGVILLIAAGAVWETTHKKTNTTCSGDDRPASRSEHTAERK
jgi:hypothetical protein